MNLDQLHQLVRKLIFVVVGFAGVAVVAFGSSIFAVHRAQSILERAINERPVIVVPGAVAGEYIAGISEENLKGAGRYLAQLGTSFTAANFRARMDELQGFADANYLPAISNDVRALEGEVLAQAQGRFFMADLNTEKLTVKGANLFEYTATGPWIFTAAGLLLSEDRGTVTVTFYLGRPSEKNKYGLQVRNLTATRTKGKA